MRLASGCGVFVVVMTGLSGCSSPLDRPDGLHLVELSGTHGRLHEPSTRLERSVSEDSAIDSTSSMGDLLVYGLIHNERVESAHATFRAAVQRVPQVAALPDPRLTFGAFLSEVETRVGPQRAQLGASQMFPWPGLLKAREDAASRAALAAYATFQQTALEVTESISRSWLEYGFLSRSTAIAERNRDLASQLSETALERYRVGGATQPDVLRAQVELGRMEDHYRSLQVAESSARARVNALLNRDADKPVPIHSGNLSSQNDRLSATPEDLLVAITVNNPRLLVLDEQIEQSRAMTEAARLDGLPAFTVGLTWTAVDDAINPAIADSGKDAVFATASINVPIWREKYDAAVREQVETRLARTSMRADLVRMLTADMHKALFEHNDADRRIGLYRDDLLPKAQQSLEATLAAFTTGGADFFDVLATQRTLLEFELSLERARTDRALALARLDTLVGGRVERNIDPMETTP